MFFPREKGATLIELLIVVSLLSIGAAVVIFSPAEWEKQRLKSASVQIQSAIGYARQIAVTEHINSQVLFNMSKNKLYVQKLIPGRTQTMEEIFLPDSVFIEKIKIGKSEYSIAFTPKGTTGDACTIQLKSRRYKTELTVNVGAGRVRLNQITN